MYIKNGIRTILTPERPEMLKNILLVVSLLAIARAQIPSLGWCPEYVRMANFDMNRFTGVWFESERYFQIFDPVSRCVETNYTKGPDGKFRVSNEVTNRFTGIKRVLEGEVRIPTTKAEEGRLHVKYATLPLNPETQYDVLETDYKSYAVLWSCSGIGPISAQNAWLMTRERRPSGEVLQKAYGVLDKYKISKTFFVKTNQDDCTFFDNVEVPKPATSTSKPTVEAPAEAAVVEVEEEARDVNLRSAIVPEAPITTNNAEAAEPSLIQPQIIDDTKPELENVESSEKIEKIEEETKISEKSLESVTIPLSVPQVLQNAADRAKEVVNKAIDEVKKYEPIEKIKEAYARPAQTLQQAIETPIKQIQNTLDKPIEQIRQTLDNPSKKILEVLNIQVSEGKETLPNEVKNAEQSKEKI